MCANAQGFKTMFDLSKLEVSQSDTKRGINFPSELTEVLAEFIGIMIGDGHLGFYPKRSKTRTVPSYEVKISGNKKEKDYLEYVMLLFFSLFGINLIYSQDTAPNAIILRIYSKGIVLFMNRLCGVPLNCKTQIVCIPQIIKDSELRLKYAFLRGLADTDFSVTFKNRTNKGHNYPVIKGSFKSRVLIEDLETIFDELGFRHCVCYDERRYDKRRCKYDAMHSIYLNGKRNFNMWTEKIGFSNPKFQRKAKKWQEDGICPPEY